MKGGKSTKSKRQAVPRAEAPKATGRLPIDISEETIEGMAQYGASMENVAKFLQVDVTTIKRRFATIFEKHDGGKCIKLQQAQFLSAMGSPARKAKDANPITGEAAVPARAAQDPDVRMQIHLGKHWLGQRDKVELTGRDGGPIAHSGPSDDERAEQFAEMQAIAIKRMKAASNGDRH